MEAFTRTITPAMALSLGRLTSAALGITRAQTLGPAEAWAIGSALTPLIVSAARRGRSAGPSWVLVLLLFSADGALAALPLDQTTDAVAGLADNAAVMVAGAMVSALAFTQLLRVIRLEPLVWTTQRSSERPAARRARELDEPWSQTRTKRTVEAAA